MDISYTNLIESIVETLLKEGGYSFDKENPFSVLKAERQAPSSRFDRVQTRQTIDSDEVADTTDLYLKGNEGKNAKGVDFKDEGSIHKKKMTSVKKEFKPKPELTKDEEWDLDVQELRKRVRDLRRSVK